MTVTGGVTSTQADTSSRSSFGDEKKDVSAKPGKPGGLKIAENACDVKKLQNSDISNAVRPFKVDIGRGVAEKERHAKLHPHLPRYRKHIDGAKRDTSPTNVDFQKPPKPKLEAHSFKMKAGTATLAAGGAGFGGFTVGTAIGATAGSVVPIIGTAVGAVVGALVGVAVGHLVKKYSRSRSHRRYLQNAIKSLEDQGVKFTPMEKQRLERLRPDQWEHLTKDYDLVIKALKEYSTREWGEERWAKQYYYQFAVMAVAKSGYDRARARCRKVVRLAKQDYDLGSGVFVQDLVFPHMQHYMSEWGADTFRTAKRAETRAKLGATDLRRSEAKKSWKKLIERVETEFGPNEAEYFVKRWRRYYDRSTQFGNIDRVFHASRRLRRDLKAFLTPHLRNWCDEPIRSRIWQLVDAYALDIAVGDISSSSFYDAHGNFDQALIEKLVGTAARLKKARDGFSPKGDAAVRQATLPNRISGYADACNRSSEGLYRRFIGGADDIFDECVQLLKMPERKLVAGLKPIGRRSDASADRRATLQAKTLRHIAELAGRLKNSGVKEDLARMILRLEAVARASDEGDPAELKPAKDIKVAPGWSPKLSAKPEAGLPDKQPVMLASDAAQQALFLGNALKYDPEFKHLTARDVEDICFDLASVHWRAGEDASKFFKRLRENNWSAVKEILRQGVDVGLAYQSWVDGSLSLKDAIDCARLNVDVKNVLNVAKIDKDELVKWHRKGFSNVEIAAYRNRLADWGVQVERGSRPKLVDKGRIGIDDERMAFFQGSNLTHYEANRLLALGLVPNKGKPSVVKLRHHDPTTHVLSDKPLGKGANNQVYMQTIKETDGSINRYVFKPVALNLNNYDHLEEMKRRIGSNLAASMVNEQLGFEAIVDTQMSMRNRQIGISMELAKGYSGSRLRRGHDTFVTVPKDVPRYAKLHAAVKEDLERLGAISEETREWARENLKFTRLRMVGGELQATGDFMADLLKDPSYREKLVDHHINVFLNDELDSHGDNYIIDVRLGPNGATAAAVKGIDNDAGFAAGDYYPNSIRTMPRVMSRRQVDAIKDMHREWKNNGSFKQKLSQVVRPSDIYVPVKPDIAFPFKHSRDATAAALPPPAGGDQVLQFEKRLDLLYQTILLAEEGKSPMRPDNYPALTIITGGAPKNEEPVKTDSVGNIQFKEEIKIDLDIGKNWGPENDVEATWGSELVDNILTNTSSVFSREKMNRY